MVFAEQKNTIIEPSGVLSPLAQIVTPDAKVVNGNFEDFNIVNKFEGIAMNPPFGTGGKTAIEHLAKAYRHLVDGGRIIAIVPEGAQCDKRFDKWFYGDEAEDAVLTVTIRLPSVAFQRAGTSVATKILVIDKLRNTNGRVGHEYDFSSVKDINELFDRMEDLQVPERHAALTAENPFVDVEKDFREITTKEAKNGSKLYCIDGQRVKYEDAVNESLRQTQAKADVLANMFREIFDVDEKKYSNARVYVPFETATGAVDHPSANFNSLEEAIKFARWLQQNYASTLWQDEHSVIDVRSDRYGTDFTINTASGEETSRTSAAKKIVAKLDAEENAVPNETATKSKPQREQAVTQKQSSAETAATNQVAFETGTFTHTKTGKNLAEAKLTNRLGKDEFKQLTALAKKHHGNYSNFSQSFLFKSPKDRDAFVREAQGESSQVQQAQPTVDDNEKFFGTGNQYYGEKKPVAFFKGDEFLDDLKTNETNSALLPATRACLEELAQKHNGELAPNGEYVFDTEQDRDAFVNEAVPIVRAEAESQKQRRDELTQEFKSLGTEGFFETGKFTTVDGRTVIGVYVKPDALGGFDWTSGLSSTLTKKAESYGGKRITLNKTQLAKAERTHKSFSYEQVTRADGTVVKPQDGGLFLYFKTNKDRDNFVSDTVDFLAQQAALKKHLREVRDRASEENRAVTEQREKRRAADKPKIDKIISDAKETAYGLLEADKYPEVKEIVDDWFEVKFPQTIKVAQEIAEQVLKAAQDAKVQGGMAYRAADKLFWNWLGKHENSRSGNVKATRLAANKLMNEARRQAGDISDEQLYEELSTLFNNANRKFYRSEAQLNEAAKNPDTADAMKQLGAEISDDKVTFPDAATLKAVNAYLDVIKSPAPETQAQPETLPTPDFASAQPLTDDEIEKITFNNDPKELVVDERLGATLYNKYPDIKEAVDVLFEHAQAPVTYDRRKDAVRDDARKHLLTLLREDFSPRQAELVGAQYMIDIWRAKKIHGTKPSDKSEKINDELTAIIKNAHNDKTNLNSQDIYQRVAKLLFPEKFLTPDERAQKDAAKAKREAKKTTEEQSITNLIETTFNELAEMLDAKNRSVVKEYLDGVKSETFFHSMSEAKRWQKEILTSAQQEMSGKNAFGRLEYAAAAWLWSRNSAPAYAKHKDDFRQLSVQVKSGEVSLEKALAQLKKWGYSGEISSTPESSAETPKATLDIRTRSNGKIDFCALNNQRQTFAEATEHAIELSPDAPIKISVDGKTVTYDAHIGNTDDNFSNARALQEKIRDILNGKTDEQKNNTFTVTVNEKPEVADNTIKITTKQSKSGATIYYDPRGNKIPESQATLLEGSSFSGSPYDSKHDHAEKVLRSYKPKGESTTNANEARDKGYDYYVYARYRVGKSLNGTGRHFQTLEDAVACAKYFYQNKGNLRTDDIDVFKGQSQSSSGLLVQIDKDGNGTFTDAAKNSSLKSSLRGSGDTSRENIVEPRTQQQRILQRLGQDIGQRVVFFDNPNKDFHGAHVGNTTFLNVNSEFALPQVFWHETAHWLKLNNPELYRRLLKAANITDAQRKAYLEDTERTDLKTDAEIDEEIIADRMEDVFKRAGFLRDIGRKDQNLIERLIAWLQDMFSKFREYFQNPQGKLTRAQAQRMANELGRMAQDIVNQHGEKIFRYNAKTHTTELATGESLENLYAVAEREAKESAQAAQTKKALVELARNAWNDKDFNGKVSFTPSKKFRDKAQEIFGHDVTTVFITASDVRHIKNHHGTNEKNRGQIDMTPNDIADIYDVVNDFSSAKRERDDKDGNKTISVTSKDGLGYTLLIERGKRKAQVRTSFKWKKAQVLNVTSPEPNVRNDPALSSAENIPQTEFKHNAALVKQFGGRIVDDKPVFDNKRDEADYQRYVEAERRGEVKLSMSRPAVPIDNQQRFDDNETYIQNEILNRFQDDNLLNQINDKMTIAKAREIILKKENGAVSRATILYNRCANAKRVDTKELEFRRARLKEALANATRARRIFNSVGMLEKVGAALQSRNKGRKGSSLAETLQRVIDGGRTGDFAERGREVIQIPGGYRGMYERPIVKELLEEIRNEREHSERQGAFSSGKKKFAGNGELARHFRNATKLKPDELNGREQKWVELGESLGVEVVWMDAHTDLKGAVDDGKIYLNRNTSEDTVKTFWHEQFHMLEAANPELHRDLMTYFTGKDAFTKAQLDAYRETNNRRDLTDEQTVDEILCDNFAQVQKRVKLIREMSADNPSLAGRFVAWLKYLADKVASLFRNPEGGMTTAQRDTFVKAVNDLVKDFGVDSQIQTGLMFSGTVTNLTTKIKTAFTTVKNERTHNHMRKLLEEVSGYRIRTGRFAKGVGNDPVDDVAKVIRTPAAYDWDTIVPAVGKLVAEKLKLNPSPEMTDYVTRWFVDGATTDNSAEAKDFQQAMRQADDYYRNKLYEVREQFEAWNKRAPEEKVRDSIAHGKPEKPLTDEAKGFFDGAYEQLVEELFPVKQLVDAFEEELHRKLTDEENPYVLLRNYRGMAGRAKIMVEEGAAAIEALKAALPDVNFDNFKTIRMILESCDALNNEERRKQFSDYLLACSVKDLHNLNNANLQAQAQLKRLIEQLEDAMDATTDRDVKAEAREQIKTRKAQLANLKSQIYATPFSEKVCDATIAKYKPEYGKAQQDMMAFQNTLLDIMVDSGILSAESRDEYKARYPNHVPHFRAFDENENVSFGDSLKQMSGSTRDVIDPLESIVRNTYSFIRRAEKNKAKLALVNLARTGGAGEVFDEISKPNGATHTSIPFFEDGKKKYLDTDPAIAKVVNNLAPLQMSWFMKFIRIGTMILRNFATVYNPAFALRNFVMDDQNAMLYSKYGFFSPADLVRGFLSVLNRDADFQQWMAMGGAQASFWSVDRDYTQASIDQLTKGKWKQYKSKPWNLFSMLGEYSELATRVGYFKKVKKSLAAQNGGKIDRETLITAALESRDLTDFARGGKSSRTWNSLSAFANASIQGWDKFFRTFDLWQLRSKDKTVRQQCIQAWIRLAIGSILPAVLCFMINHDEDWYEKDLPDWERQTHWCLGENLRVPKGQDVGLRFFSNLTESILRSMSGDKKAFENWWKPAYESLPDLMPTAIQPIIECMTNYDMFRKHQIVPMRRQNLPEYMQFDSRTSATAKFIGDSALVKFFVGETGLSPEKIDHFLYGYTGKMGREILRTGESIIGARSYDFKGISDVPLIGGYFRTPYTNPRVLTEFYEKLDEQTKLHNEFKLTKKRPEGYDHNLYTRLKKASDEMKKFAQAERKVIDDTSLDFDVRDERQNKLQKRRVELASRALR